MRDGSTNAIVFWCAWEAVCLVVFGFCVSSILGQFR